MSPLRRAIGVDIGGTKTTVAAVDASGRVHAEVTSATNSQRGFPPCLVELVDAIRAVIQQAGWAQEELAGIGIGCAGPVNPARGTIHNPFTLPGWEGADITTPLADNFHVPIRLENDADAAVMGEQRWGSGRGASPLVMVTLGTGIGGGILLRGEIHRGVNGEHPEPGHLPVQADGPECYCGRRGCWESLASGTAIAAAGKPFGFADSRALFAAAPNDPNAAAIVLRAVNATATAAWALAHTFLPQRIILGGGIGSEHFDRFADAVRQALSRATQFSPGAVEIARAGLGSDAGVIGAAALVLPAAASV